MAISNIFYDTSETNWATMRQQFLVFRFRLMAHSSVEQTWYMFLIYLLIKLMWVFIVQHNCVCRLYSFSQMTVRLSVLPGAGCRRSQRCLHTNTTTVIVVTWLMHPVYFDEPRWRRSACWWRTAAAWLRMPFGSSGCTGASVVWTTAPCHRTGLLVSLPCPAPRIPCAWSLMECLLKCTCL